MVTCNVGRVRHRIDACVRTRELRVQKGHFGYYADFVHRHRRRQGLFVKAWRTEGFDSGQFVSSVDVAT